MSSIEEVCHLELAFGGIQKLKQWPVSFSVFDVCGSRWRTLGTSGEPCLPVLHHVLFRDCIPAQNITTKKQAVEKRVYSDYTSKLLFISKGSQNMNSHRTETWRQVMMQRPWRGTSYCLAFPGLLSLLSYRTQDYQPRDDTTNNGPFPLEH